MTKISNNNKTSISNCKVKKHLLILLFSTFSTSNILAFDFTQFLPQEFKVVDSNHVDFQSSSLHIELTDVAIGSSQRKLAHTLLIANGPGGGNFGGFINDSSNDHSDQSTNSACKYAIGTYAYSVAIGWNTEKFCKVNDEYVSARNPASILKKNSDGSFTVISKTGIIYKFSSNNSFSVGLITQEIHPDGLTLNYNYKKELVTYPDGSRHDTWRIRSVVRNDGFQLLFKFKSDLPPSVVENQYSDWYLLTGVVAFNNAVDYCDPAADSCSFTRRWPESSFTKSSSTDGTNYYFFQDFAGNNSRITSKGSGFEETITNYKSPSSASEDTIQYKLCTDIQSINVGQIEFVVGIQPADLVGKNNENQNSLGGQNNQDDSGSQGGVGNPGGGSYGGGSNIVDDVMDPPSSRPFLCSATRDGQTWKYGHQTTKMNRYSRLAFVGRTSPTGSNVVMVSQYSTMGSTPLAPLLTSVDEEGNAFLYDTTTPYGRVTSIRKPEGNTISYLYDARGNVTNQTHTPKPGSGLSPISTLIANYDTMCTNPITCNKPNWVRDAKGNQTDFLYDPVHGGVISETSPPDSRGVRPQKRFSYAQRYAWVKNDSGALVHADTPIWVLIQESYCKTSAVADTGVGCSAGAADEVITTYDYGPDAAPNNLFLRGVAVTSDNQTHRTCYTYDVLGNKTSETTPNAARMTCS